MIFSDILGDNLLFTTVNLNGEIYDVGAAVQYLNQKSQLAWGILASHIPNRAGFSLLQYDTLENYGLAIRADEFTFRVFEEQVAFLVQYPISRSLRLEGNVGLNYRFYSLDSTAVFYDATGRFYLTESKRFKIPSKRMEELFGFSVRDVLYYNQNVAMVGDNSQFGMASPVNGYRYRFDFTNYVGGYKFQTVTADMRFYQYLKPITLAFRALHFSTLGEDSDSFYPILIGDMGLVHGFNYGRLREHQEDSGISPEQLSGSKIIVSGFEVRLPFTGPKRFAAIKSNVLYSELAWFFDGGVAFYEYKHLGDFLDESIKPKTVFSTGISARVNLFGALVVEPYYAWPLLEGATGKFGVFLVPGW
jgi:hypothetical protein